MIKFFQSSSTRIYLKSAVFLVIGVYLNYEQSSFGVLLKGETPQFVNYPLTVTLATICEFFNLGSVFQAIYFSLGLIGAVVFAYGLVPLWRQVFHRPLQSSVGQAVSERLAGPL